MGVLVDAIMEKAIELVSEYILNGVKDKRKKELWKNSVIKAFEATEGIEDAVTDYFVKLPVMQRHFLWLISKKPKTDVYRSFIISLAVDLCAFNLEKKYAESLGMAILDNWFEADGEDEDYQENRNQIAGEKISEIIEDREKLYREFFLLYNDPLAKDVIRVYYPRNGESWIEWDKKCSVDVKINLSRGTEFGFFRTGFSYRGLGEHDYEKNLKVAFISKDREILRFNNDTLSDIDEKNILYID